MTTTTTPTTRTPRPAPQVPNLRCNEAAPFAPLPLFVPTGARSLSVVYHPTIGPLGVTEGAKESRRVMVPRLAPMLPFAIQRTRAGWKAATATATERATAGWKAFLEAEKASRTHKKSVYIRHHGTTLRVTDAPSEPLPAPLTAPDIHGTYPRDKTITTEQILALDVNGLTARLLDYHDRARVDYSSYGSRSPKGATPLARLAGFRLGRLDSMEPAKAAEILFAVGALERLAPGTTDAAAVLVPGFNHREPHQLSFWYAARIALSDDESQLIIGSQYAHYYRAAIHESVPQAVHVLLGRHRESKERTERDRLQDLANEPHMAARTARELLTIALTPHWQAKRAIIAATPPGALTTAQARALGRMTRDADAADIRELGATSAAELGAAIRAGGTLMLGAADDPPLAVPPRTLTNQYEETAIRASWLPEQYHEGLAELARSLEEGDTAARTHEQSHLLARMNALDPLLQLTVTDGRVCMSVKSAGPADRYHSHPATRITKLCPYSLHYHAHKTFGDVAMPMLRAEELAPPAAAAAEESE